MERRDQKRLLHKHYHDHQANSSWTEVVDESTTELSGSRQEANLIVWGLKALRLQLAQASLMGLRFEGDEHGSYARQLTEENLTRLIESIEKPNYTSEPQKREESFSVND